MRLRTHSALAIIVAAGLLSPLTMVQQASATARGGSETTSTSSADCSVTSAPSQVETGSGIFASNIADVVQVECRAKFSEQKVKISSPRLSSLCRHTLSWYSDSSGSGRGTSFDVTLDDDGNATAVVWGGPSCATGTAEITADLVRESSTASTFFTVIAPKTTKTGITPVPASEVEDATYSGAAFVFQVEFPSKYAENSVTVSSPQLSNRCGGHLTWYGAEQGVLGSGQSAVVTLDDNGNAFVVALAGPSCASGSSLVTADLDAAPFTTLHTHVKILPPQVTFKQKATPGLSTTPSAGGTVGAAVLNDTGDLSGGKSPTGSITFNLYDPSQSGCTGTPAYTQTVTVSGDGSYATSNTAPAATAGTWNWTAAYSGDAQNNGVSTSCGKETVTVAKASPSLATAPSPGGEAGKVVLNDTGTLTGSYHGSGSITFNLYDPSQTTCTGTPAYTQTVTVSGDGSYSTSNTAPATTSGTWNWTATYSGDGNNNGASSSCGQEPVTVATVPQGSCEGSGSISTLVSGTNVTSYVPKGAWDSSTTGIDAVNVEGTSITNTLIPTGSDVINSCASNSATGQTVCTANNNHVYVLKGTGLDPSVSPNPLTDAGTGSIGFSGGSATTTGVSMDGTDNKALIALSLGGTGGFQFLDLATDTFGSAFQTEDPNGNISEDPLIDPVHHLILSASEDDNYELIDVSKSTPRFYEHPVSGVSGELDSSAEDCSTGIIFAPAEGAVPSQVEIADISNPGSPPEAVFTPGTPGSWTAPEQVQTLTGSELSAGASGSAVAQGTHTGVVAGEFGGDGLTALAMPTTSGAGAVPAFSNWVSCETGNGFSMGDDPHTLAAYQSPNGGDAIALMVNEGATEMVRVDLTDMLNPAIVPATGNVCNSGTLPASAESFIPLP